MEKIQITPSSEIIYNLKQRTTFYIEDSKLNSQISYAEKRRQPEINLYLNKNLDVGSYVAQAQYKWAANCSHLLYDVLSDHFVLKEITGSKYLVHKPNGLSSQVIKFLNSELILGVDEKLDDPENKYSYLELGLEFGTWKHSGHMHSYLSNLIRKCFKDLMVNDPNSPKNIIINRKLTASHSKFNRNIHNIDGFVNDLKNKYSENFTVIELEGLTLQDQIKYFYNAEKIISIHGSGLVWLNFCKENTKVIEIVPPWFKHDKWLKHDFWIIGNQHNLDYKMLYIDQLVGDSSSAYDFDVIVPVSIVTELLRMR
jgi:hypothetical protein